MGECAAGDVGVDVILGVGVDVTLGVGADVTVCVGVGAVVSVGVDELLDVGVTVGVRVEVGASVTGGGEADGCRKTGSMTDRQVANTPPTAAMTAAITITC